MYTPESLFSYLKRAQDRREESKRFKDPPMRGPSMILEAYKKDWESCHWCNTNEFLVPINNGSRGHGKIAVFRFKCTQCGGKF